MFRKHEYQVSERAYLFHYFVKDKNDPSIEVRFNSHVDLVMIDIDAIKKKLQIIFELLNSTFPGNNPECNTCSYYDGRKAVLGRE